VPTNNLLFFFNLITSDRSMEEQIQPVCYYNSKEFSYFYGIILVIFLSNFII
jgi:hypothetical protein